MSAITPLLTPIHREGRRFIALFALVTLVLFFVWQPLGWIGVLLTAWCVFFFRDPDRVTPVGDDLVIAPADGLIVQIAAHPPPPELGMDPMPRTRIGIFMNVFDTHVNRSPVSGRVAKLAYTRGRFVNATLDKASEHNERQAIRLALPDGREVAAVQIAGLIARRIVCDLHEGQGLRAGQRIGMIRFGSRVDVYLPPGVVPVVAKGQRTVAGETVLADLTSNAPARPGEVR
jgi:phosphatidylserine decarboxylase